MKFNIDSCQFDYQFDQIDVAALVLRVNSTVLLGLTSWSPSGLCVCISVRHCSADALSLYIWHWCCTALSNYSGYNSLRKEAQDGEKEATGKQRSRLGRAVDVKKKSSFQIPRDIREILIHRGHSHMSAHPNETVTGPGGLRTAWWEGAHRHDGHSRQWKCIVTDWTLPQRE